MSEPRGYIEEDISQNTNDIWFTSPWYHENIQSTGNVHPTSIDPRLLHLLAPQRPLSEPRLTIPPFNPPTQRPQTTPVFPNQPREWTEERKRLAEAHRGKTCVRCNVLKKGIVRRQRTKEMDSMHTSDLITHHANPVYFLAGDATIWESGPSPLALRITNNIQYPTLEVMVCSFSSNFLTPKYRRYSWETRSWQSAENANCFAFNHDTTSAWAIRSKNDRMDTLTEWAIRSVSEHSRLYEPAYDSFFTMASEYTRKKLPLAEFVGLALALYSLTVVHGRILSYCTDVQGSFLSAPPALMHQLSGHIESKIATLHPKFASDLFNSVRTQRKSRKVPLAIFLSTVLYMSSLEILATNLCDYLDLRIVDKEATDVANHFKAAFMEVHPTKMDWNDPREVELVGEDVVNMFKEVIRQICGVGVDLYRATKGPHDNRNPETMPFAYQKMILMEDVSI
ncbi:MAG: hypothetical protein M1813_009660 [Trichoglossum hirsutum]|nr:MAG: hypothetical protein M1813_009660 [Trichoglossum hirsutum]